MIKLSLKEIAECIVTSLEWLECGEWEKGDLNNGLFCASGAGVYRGRIWVEYADVERYVLCRAEAEAYLDALTEGWRGYHFRVPGVKAVRRRTATP